MHAAEVSARTIREYQHELIDEFVNEFNWALAEGDVLDYGCGDSPYAQHVGGNYIGFNRGKYPGTPHRVDIGPAEPLIGKQYGGILCTQMLQYVPDVLDLLKEFRWALNASRGHLVLTVQTNWPEVETEDLHRFTKAGTQDLLEAAGFAVADSRQLGAINFFDFSLPLGWGFLARCT